MVNSGNISQETILSQASKEEGATTIPQGSTLKRVEAVATETDNADGYDIVWSA